MKDLPKVFANKIDKEIKNTQELFYGESRREIKRDPIGVSRKINDIFKSNNHVYKSKVKITFIDHEEYKTIVGKTGSYLITIDGEKINISNILDIVKI